MTFVIVGLTLLGREKTKISTLPSALMRYIGHRWFLLVSARLVSVWGLSLLIGIMMVWDVVC